MAGPSITQQRERIEAILATIPGVTTVFSDGDNMNCALTDAMLPAALVIDGPGVRARESRDIRTTTRVFRVGVYVAKLCGDSPSEQRAALEPAEVLMEVIADYFTERAPRLELAYQPLNGVRRIGNITDEALEFRLWEHTGDEYSAFTLGIPVETHR